MFFMIEQAILLVIGALTNVKWAWIWGACGVAAAVLYFLRDLTFLWLILLGFALIGIVIWRLLKLNKK